ncbi:putative cytochrome P450 123 [Mycolicibacterium arabiense]|jgi:cytochrome P450|uniref:Steroid C26-monooxygenase n=1 Tax=Mycolicibacterium arabiense TaxID=1286181 RepID=A0A7I7S6D4_9MYCO|nr:cytochrome P450 [Mycolicibacterium arabiense]MCV7372963.1 cytochrome P450 [Mycolicibacterium arabiense]BBY51856.1 putative cytochrome P450 123 [Mycolicibacterium arabiense]
MVAVQIRYDPFDASILSDPYPTYRLLRDTVPVYRAEESHTWVLSRHADVQAAALDHGTYSSVDGIFPTPPGSNFIGSFLPMMIVMDPPRHDQLRALVSRAFTPRRVAGLQDAITQMAAELFERLDEGSGRADFVTDFAAILPAAVIADLLGVPATDRDQFRVWSSQVVQVDVNHGQTSDALAAAAAIYAYFTDFLADRRKNSREDLMSALANAAVDGVVLTDEEVLGFCALLLVAGYETTTNLLGNSAVVLAQHRQIRRCLGADRTLLGPAVEELLRYDSPAQGLSRTLTRDVTLHGTTMRQGEKGLLLFGSANRDERAFPEPDVFDIERRSEHQVAFGRGIHFCLGASLARMETRIALNALLDKVPDWEVDLDSARRLRSGPIRGYTSLPITWTTAV